MAIEVFGCLYEVVQEVLKLVKVLQVESSSCLLEGDYVGSDPAIPTIQCITYWIITCHRLPVLSLIHTYSERTI